MDRFNDEWLEPDGAGGFASGPVAGPRARRYHALLLAESAGQRFLLVNGVEAWLIRGDVRTPLSTARYLPDVLYPTGYQLQTGFAPTPFPTWTIHLSSTETLIHTILMDHETGATLLTWRLENPTPGPAHLEIRPLLTGRNYHALHRRNPDFDFTPHLDGNTITWRPYPGVPAITATSNAAYIHAPDWFMNVLYAAERERGFDGVEDMASPGLFTWDLAAGPATLAFQTTGRPPAPTAIPQESARRARLSPTDLAANAYLATGPLGPRLLAGFPWFEDWGRDTFIAMRGLLIGTGRHAEALAILLAWAPRLHRGLLPNRLSADDAQPEYNTVDAALWFIIAAHELIEAAATAAHPIPAADEQTLKSAFNDILTNYQAGTLFGIRAEPDGLLACGEPGTQLTWMDARVDGSPITPRIGKPVEIQALWINALHIAGQHNPAWREPEAQARAAFARFTNPATGGLHDLLDPDHVPNTADPAIRPNQIFAIGGLPKPIVEGPQAAAILALVETHLLTPLGLRTLAPSDPHYIGCYIGNVSARDHAYHQGTAWPFLLGPFVEAWLRVHGNTPSTRAQARTRFLAPLLHHLTEAGLNHISEIADGDSPHTPRGCPFQAWSYGEFIRIRRLVEEK